jgi:hypothetical protein
LYCAVASPDAKLPVEELRTVVKQVSQVLNDRLFPFLIKVDFNNVMLMAVVISAIALMTSLGDASQRLVCAAIALLTAIARCDNM